MLLSPAADAETPFFDVQFEAAVVATTSDVAPGSYSQSGQLGTDTVSLSAASLGETDI